MNNYYKILISITVLFILFFPERVSAQGKFIEGYIVNAKNDTIKGLIRYESWNRNPVYIDFKNESNSETERINALDTIAFYLPSVREKYVSRRIGVISIDRSQVFTTIPSFRAKDSLTVFLREITTGPGASLFEYVDETEREHYFLEKNHQLTELIYYPYKRLVNGREYIVNVEEYKKQLTQLFADGGENITPARSYTQKELAKTVDSYNKSQGLEIKQDNAASQPQTLIDVQIMGGIEGWEEPGITLKNAPTFGFGLRINLPRNFNNRYFRAQYAMLPGNSTYEVYKFRPDEKTNFKTIEIGVGSHFGAGNIRPNLGFDYSFPLNNWRSGIIGPHVGITFRRQIAIEVSHFANVATVISEIGFLSKPRFSVSYFLNLNRIFKPGN